MSHYTMFTKQQCQCPELPQATFVIPLACLHAFIHSEYMYATSARALAYVYTDGSRQNIYALACKHTSNTVYERTLQPFYELRTYIQSQQQVMPRRPLASTQFPKYCILRICIHRYHSTNLHSIMQQMAYYKGQNIVTFNSPPALFVIAHM